MAIDIFRYLAKYRDMKTVTFYQSMICPRCQLTKLMLVGMERDFPDVRIERVEYLANLGRARKDGVLTIPTLVSGDRKLSGILLTRRSIRRFLQSI